MDLSPNNETAKMKELATELYHQILRTSNMFLHSCKGFSVEILQKDDPTYAQLAEIARKVGRVVVALADDFDPMMGQKAWEYCDIMQQIGLAVVNGDQVALEKALKELERRPGV